MVSPKVQTNKSRTNQKLIGKVVAKSIPSATVTRRLPQDTPNMKFLIRGIPEQSREVLHERRKQVIRMHIKGVGVMQIARRSRQKARQRTLPEPRARAEHCTDDLRQAPRAIEDGLCPVEQAGSAPAH
jgi:hypothetical protein